MTRIAVIVLLLHSLGAGAQGLVPDSTEFAALKQLYDSLDGPNWTSKTNWPTAGNWPATATSAQFGTWYGITVTSGDITRIYLPNNKLKGKLPSKLKNLGSLLRLEVFTNQISGPLPAWIGNLNKLNVLYLQTNQLSGVLPSQIGNLTELTYVDLRSNPFIGTLPATLNNLTKLQYLFIGGNQFTGQIPDLGNLTKVTYLILQGSYFDYGPIPEWIGNLTSLNNLIMSGSKRTGPVSERLRQLKNLLYLDLGSNQLTGEVPSWIGELKGLWYLSLSSNQLTGEIPEGLGSLANMQQLYLQGNRLTGELPPSLGNMSKLNYLFVYNNLLSGRLPASLGNLSNLVYLQASGNQFNGAVPPELMNLTKLVYCYLYSNEFTSSPNFSLHPNKANLYLKLENNRFSFESIEPLYSGTNVTPLKSLTASPQKKVNDYTQLTAIESGSLSVMARTRGPYSSLTWEYSTNGTAWAAATGNQDATGATYYRVPATKTMAGWYRWRMSSTRITTFTIESDPIIVTVVNGTQQFLDNWAFQYRYDFKNRMVAKRVPGADWVYMVYDSLDRLILTQDGNQRPNRQWLYTKYDGLDRPIMTGIYTHSAVVDQSAMAKLVSKTLYSEKYDGTATNHGYTNTVWPTAGLEVLSVTYYDDYSFKSLWSDAGFNYKPESLVGLPPAEFLRVQGKVTGTKTKVLGRDQWVSTISYYDDLQRPVQSVSSNPRGGKDRVSTLYDFLGKVIATRNEQSVGYLDWVMRGVEGTSSRLHKSDRTSGWNAGASGIQQLAAGADGWIEFFFPENTTQKVIGLSDADVNDLPATIDYGVGFSPSPLRLEVWENGTIYALTGTPVPGELLRIERKAGVVRYYRNGSLVRTSAVASATALIADVSFNHPDASVAGINASFAEPRSVLTSRRMEYDHADRPTRLYHTIEGPVNVTWKNMVGVESTATGGLKKTSTATGWGTAGASSSQVIPAYADGYAEMTIRSTTSNRLLGLSAADENAGIDKVDYGLLLSANNLQVIERNVNRGNLGTVQNGDIVRVQRVDGSIVYKRNGTVFYSSTVASSTELLADVSIESASAEMEPVRLSAESDEVLLTETKYNATGTAIDKKLHSVDNGSHFRQSVDYRYNIRGWITHINNSDLSPHDPGDPRDLFGMELGYNNALNTGQPPALQFNGNISAVKWSANLGLGAPTDVKERSYAYNYDAMNRILSASFVERKADWIQDGSFSESGYTYDQNGNILSLTRKGAAGLLLDALSYDYGNSMGKSNRLLKVSDSGHKKEGFREGTNTGSDYTYDANGNMITDANKDIASIAYNHLNLPAKVTKVSGDFIWYLYDAGGRKLSQWVYEAVPKRITKTTDYLGEAIYENDALHLVQHEEGRIVSQAAGEGTFEYQYHLKDHLGNVRLTFSSKVEKDEYLATMENDTQAEEQSQFQNYSRVPADLFDHTDAGLTYTYAQRLTGATGAIIGLAKSLRVEPGDTVQVEVFAKYLNASGGASNVATGLAGALTGAFGLTSTMVGEPAAAYSAINTLFSAGSLLALNADVDPGAPKAFLNILLFDDKYNLVDLAFEQIDAGAKQEVGEILKQPHDWLYRQVVVSKPGYAYIYVSNENPTLVEVYFDDLTLTHRKSPVVQWDDYYPFGMPVNSHRRENSAPNRYKYNGMEEANELILNWLFPSKFRTYDPTTGRFMQVDPELKEHESPFAWNTNNPLLFADPTGADSTQRAQAVAMARQYIDENCGNTYPTKEQKEDGQFKDGPSGFIDCSGLVGNAVVAGGEENPTEKGTGSGVERITQNTERIGEKGDMSNVVVGTIVTINNTPGKGALKPENDYKHVGIISEVTKDSDGKITSMKMIHSSGNPSKGKSGPNEVSLVGGNTSQSDYWGARITGFYKWDTKPDK